MLFGFVLYSVLLKSRAGCEGYACMAFASLDGDIS